jgi:hypothetical protein
LNEEIILSKLFALKGSSPKDCEKFFQEKNQVLENTNVVAGLRKAQIQKSHFVAPEVSEF